jgi:hypothetical protein
MLEIGILKTWNSTTYKAGLQLAGSLTTYLDDISVSVSIPSSAMIVGNFVLVAVPHDNLKDACVIAAWPAGSTTEALIEAHRTGDVHVLAQIPQSHDNAKHSTAYAAQADFLAHKTRHEWLGADALSIGGLMANLLFFHEDWGTDPTMSGRPWTSQLAGTGTYLWDGPMQVWMHTGATSGGRSTLYSMKSGYFKPSATGKIWAATVQSATLYTSTLMYVWMIYASASIPPANENVDHAGFIVQDTILYASNANGSAQTKTAIGTWNSAWSGKVLAVVGTADSLLFYVNSVLKATHTTNLPNKSEYRMFFQIINSVDETRGMKLVATNFIS